MEWWYEARVRVMGAFESIIDRLVVFFQFFLLSLTQERRIINASLSLLLGFMNKQALEKMHTERRGRIHVNSDSEEDVTWGSEEDGTTKLGFETLIEKSPSPTHKRRKTADGGPQQPPKLPKRPLRYNIQPGMKQRDTVFVHEKVTTGIFEDLFLSLLVWIENTVQGFRHRFLSIMQVLEEIRFRKLLRSAFDVKSNIKTVFWFLTFIWPAIKVIWWIIISPTKVSGGFRSVKQKLIQIQQRRIDTRQREEVVVQQGYPYQEYEVITKDGYILKLERLPRPESKKVDLTEQSHNHQ